LFVMVPSSALAQRVYGPSSTIGAGGGLSWIAHPDEPAPEHGIGGEIAFLFDMRPVRQDIHSARLEIALAVLSDVGAGTLIIESRLYPIALDLGPLIWRVGGHVGIAYRAPGYGCRTCAARDEARPAFGGDMELVVKLWEVMPTPEWGLDGRLEVGLHASIEARPELDGWTYLGRLGVRASYLVF
jgi:hypothetical protein